MLASRLVLRANLPQIRAWTESLWGAKSPYAPKQSTRDRAKTTKQKARMPPASARRELHLRDGYHCRYCGIPLIREDIRQRFRKVYPELLIWGRRNIEQHAAFQAMWAQYDHVVPHSAGGSNEMANVIVTCAPCNYAKMECTLEEAGLLDPRMREPRRSAWDGLERFKDNKPHETNISASLVAYPPLPLPWEMQPVWVAFPTIPWRSIGWRMGYGEGYWIEWKLWYCALGSEARAAYKQQWPEPDAWQGFYSGIEAGNP
jgi:5-methylcytosine-specific restriction endonuclease McrA